MTERTRTRRRADRPAGPPPGARLISRFEVDVPVPVHHAAGCPKPDGQPVTWLNPSGYACPLWRCPRCGVCWPRSAGE
jgi:hypothetical protein